mgnify:CR=1 FL=1
MQDAIMLAKFFKAKKCIIYTDVEGVFTTDPNKLSKAKKLKLFHTRNARNGIFRFKSYATNFNSGRKAEWNRYKSSIFFLYPSQELWLQIQIKHLVIK